MPVRCWSVVLAATREPAATSRLAFDPWKQTHGIAAVDRLDVVLRELSILCQAVNRCRHFDEWVVASEQHLRNRNHVAQGIERRWICAIRNVEIEFTDFRIN